MMLAKKLLDSIPKSVRIIRRLSSESLHGQLALQQIRIMVLTRDGMGQTLMAETLGVSLAAVSKIIEALVNKGLISRKAGEDRRTVILKLTPKGKKTLDTVLSQVEEKLDAGICTLNQEEKQALNAGLQVLDKLMATITEVSL